MSLMESASRYCTNQRNRDAKPIVNDQFHDGSQRQRWKVRNVILLYFFKPGAPYDS